MFHLIQEESKNPTSLPIHEMCEVLGVSRSGYYRWVNAEETRNKREERDRADFALIKKAYDYRGYAKGSRGIHMRLLRMEVRMNRKKIQRLIRKYGLFCPIRKANPYRRMAKALKTDRVAPNIVNREFRTHGSGKILLTDITYLKFQGRFLYLSVIKDAYTMQILSYKLSDSLEVDFVLETIQKLSDNYLCNLDAEVIIHSDQGCHYTSVVFRKILEDKKFRQSMSRRGNCWDNAPQESFFGHMKDEIKPYMSDWTCIEDVEYRIADYIDYYNNDRYQTTLQGMSPNEYYIYLSSEMKPSALN